ncbi:VOC family protein [Microbacterium sp.]|uniref:VOC family protein n=1 Tax=Microbacterium sp. TaxID=51671 RepID=UPI003A8B0337
MTDTTMTPAGSLVGSYAHVGIIVEDLDAAMAEMTATQGIRWLPVQERPNDDTTLRLTFSASEPYIELIEGSPGTSRDTSNGPHVDHLAYWTADFAADKQRLLDAGLTLDVEGSSPFGGWWAYLSSRVTGYRIELCDIAAFEGWHRQWGLPVPERS